MNAVSVKKTSDIQVQRRQDAVTGLFNFLFGAGHGLKLYWSHWENSATLGYFFFIVPSLYLNEMYNN